ncbi:MAG: hypothetical protein ABIZ04_14625 [Opitutus sp.]
MKLKVTFALGLLVLAVLAWKFFARPVITTVAQPAPVPVVAQAPAPVKLTPVARDTSVTEPATEDERTERNQARPEAGTGEHQLDHMFRSVVQANAAELKLTPEQTERLASDYLEFQEIYAEQAARFLQETSFDPASVSVRLPPYPVEGKLLREMFYRRLETNFSKEKSAEIRDQLGGYFDNTFRGFGQTAQSFTITRSAEVANAFEVQWNAKIPEGQPAGSMVDGGFAGSSGTALLYREQVQSGEYRFLGPVIDRRFPDTSAGAKTP